MTVRELIEAAMRKIGATATGETPSASEINDGKQALNVLLDSWSNEKLIVPARVRESFSLVVGQSVYTMGASGNFDTARPMEISQINVEIQDTPVYEIPAEIVTPEKWARITNKATTGDIPRYIWPQYNSPLVTLNVWPVPSRANRLVIQSWKPLTTYTNLSTALTLAPGYERALIYNLAIEIAPEYGLSVAPEVAGVAIESLANIKRTNSKPYYLQVEQAARSRDLTFNWLTGDTE